MQIAQRILLVTAVVFVFFAGCLYIKRTGNKKILNQWDKICSEEFLQRMTKKQEVLLNEYICFAEEIRSFASDAEIEIKVYRKEWDIEGNMFYYLLTQEELEKMLETENRIGLDEGNILQIVIKP